MNLDVNIIIYLLGLASTWGAVMWRISALEKKVLFFHLGGMDYKAIAEALDISEKSVDNALQRVRKKLKSIA